jgi:glycosyltransferase involved in cell wall biosynthesis
VKPLVSILIPAYNAAPWLADTLQCAIAQTWDRREIIVVDDGSADDTLATARKFESDSVHVYTQRNEGAAAARNLAFQLCKGDYIQWLDADDLMSRDKIERQMAVVNQCQDSRVLLSGAWGSFLYRYHRTSFVPTLLWEDLSPVDWLIRKMANNLHMQTATWLVSRELTEAAGPWDPLQFVDDDGEYFCRVLLASNGVRFVPEAQLYYRATGSGSLSQIGRSDKKRDAQWRSMELHIGYLLSLEDSPRAHAACVRYMRTWLPYFYPERMDLVEKAILKARGFGEELGVPKLSWKYDWIRTMFGWGLAKRAQIFFPSVRWSVARFVDKVLFRLENRPLPQHR